MDNEVAINILGVSKYFQPTTGQSSIKSKVTSIFKDKEAKSKGYWAIKDVSFQVQRGEFFGIVGRNGSGKSTLLKMIAGVYAPTKGVIEVNGKLVPFIELGVGFNPELSGRDNVFLNGALLGFTRKEMENMYEEIVDFAELKDHMDVKLKNFSSGMQVRLAFSIAIRSDSDILLIDEVLAVGDADFQRKCFSYFKQLKKKNKTVVFVSHDMTSIREYCDRAVLIDDSKVLEIGNASKISVLYSKTLQNRSINNNVSELGNENGRFGDRSLLIYKPKIIQAPNKKVSLSFQLKATSEVEDPIIGFYIENELGQQISGTNTQIEKIKVSNFVKNENRKVDIAFDNVFSDGRYYCTLAILKNSGSTVCDWWPHATSINISTEQHIPYLISLPVKYREKSTHD